jgi:hypothetical protein
MPGVTEKAKQVMFEKYGIENYWLRNRKNIIELNMPLNKWHENLSEPKPRYGVLCSSFIGKTEINLNEVEEFVSTFIKNIGSNNTKLEIFAENLLSIKHFGQRPKELTRLYKPDFKLSEKIYLNVDGLYWHSEKRKDNDYHFIMRQEFESSNLRLFQFHEDEVYNKSDIIKSIVSNALGMTPNKLYARKTTIKIVPQIDANEFLINNHLMGKTMAKHIGLYDIIDDTRLLALMSYKVNGVVCKIERFCSLVDYNIVGGFSKLLSYIENNCLKGTVKQIHNWVDLRYGTGVHLSSKGFQMARETQGWKWSDGTCTHNRLKCRANMDERMLSEKDHAEELGWYRLYDAGQRLYIKEIK